METDAIGIVVYGPGNRVINNDVYETKGDLYSYGIYAVNAPGVVIANNRVGNAELGSGTSYGVLINFSDNAMAKDNTSSVMTYGIRFTNSNSGLYMNNLASGCTNPFLGGSAAGSTNYSVP